MKESVTDIFKWEENEVFIKVAEYIKEPPTIIKENEFAIWIRKSPICLMAHVDVVSGFHGGYSKWDGELKKMVHVDSEPDIQRKDLNVIMNRNTITATNGILGGDDRGGIIGIMMINEIMKLKEKELPNIILTNGEERGSHGAKELVKVIKKEQLEHVNLIISMDRKGCGEYVYYIDPPMEVEKYMKSFGFRKGFGSYSDCRVITEEWNIPHVNVSVGYYDNHCNNEVLQIDELQISVNRISQMMEEPISKRYETKKSEYVYRPVHNQYNSRWNSYDNRKSEMDEMMKERELEDKRKVKVLDYANKHNLLPCSRRFPYLDFLLPPEICKEGYHIVSTPKGSKLLEEWYLLFHTDSKFGKPWRDDFGKEDRLYVLSSNNDEFYLAIKSKNTECVVIPSATWAERKQKELFEEAIKENKNNAKEEQSGENYCAAFWQGYCGGGCGGDSNHCNNQGGPFDWFGEGFGF